jgi:hypothetical protein
VRPEDIPAAVQLPSKEDLSALLAVVPSGPEFMGEAARTENSAAMAMYAFFHWVFRGYRALVSLQDQPAQEE